MRNFPFPLTPNQALPLDGGRFRRYSLTLSSVLPVAGRLAYLRAGEPRMEEFFLPAGENVAFTSLVDGILEGEQAEKPLSLSFSPLLAGESAMVLHSLVFSDEKVPQERQFLENGILKVGASLRFGGGLDYLEALALDVAAVWKNGRAEIGPGFAKGLPEGEILTRQVNLLNCHDTGRLVQQSYYGTAEPPYVQGEFMGLPWRYNPVMGGDKSNANSKIVDFARKGNALTVKCRPMDWGHANRPTPSYMEATYTIDGDCLRVDNRFTDFSGLEHPATTQELPAFYVVEPLNRLVCFDGGLQTYDGLPFWHQRGVTFSSSENWWAFVNKEEDGFGVGLLSPGVDRAVGGIYKGGEALSALPAESDPTSYFAPVSTIKLQPFLPFSYSYLVCAGTLSRIRQAFAEKRSGLPSL